MNPSRPNNGSPSPQPLPSTNNDEALSQSLRRLSLTTASATALPPSPQVASPQRTLGQRNYPSSPSGSLPPRSPLRRSPSSMSVDGRASTPTSLQRKASMNSLRGGSGATPPRATQSRRSSSTQFTNGSAMGKSPLSGVEDAPPPPPPPTAADIASGHFQKELGIHTEDMEEKPADTIVILHDSCYGHRFSRPRTSRAALSTIVERPERIHASILGVSVAYVRLGERHAEGRYPIHPKKNPSNIPNIPFRIRKTTRRMPLSSPAVTNVHGTKWMEELKIMCDGAEAKLAMNGKELTRPEMQRSPDHGAPSKLHEGDLYLCSESLNAMEGALGAVCEGVDAVFQGAASGKGPRRAFVAIRPPGHHCSASYPSGFCWVNNVHVGIAHATLAHGLTHAAIIDFDLHHGDGSQAIAWEHNTRSQSLPKNAAAWKKTSIGYFSLHDINSYPCEMGDEEKVKNASLCVENAHGQSIWNVHLQPWKSEAEFWELYETRYAVLLEKTRTFLKHHTQRFRSLPSSLPNAPQPKAAIFLSAGFDASEWESSGMQRHKVNVPTEFYARLTRDVVKLAAEEECSVAGRVISVLEGGYSDRALSSGVLSHLSGLAGGDPMEVKTEVEHGLGYEMAKKAGAFKEVHGAGVDLPLAAVQPYDASWWALPQLENLDSIVNPPAPPPEPKKPKDAPPPTYFSPTQSFSAKIVGSPKPQRSPSGLSTMNGSSPRIVSRPPSPPPPDIYWATAAHELSKLLIPTDRQTMSCKPEDLSAEATRARRDRQSILSLPTASNSEAPSSAPPVRMSLRERKAVKLSTPEEEEEKPVSRTNRRKTVAGSAVLVTEKAVAQGATTKPEPGYTQPTKQSTRRLSMVSATGSVTSEAPTIPISNGHARTSSIGQKTFPNRPGSSQSMRPDSVMSSRGHSIPPVVVKKTRTVNPTRSDAVKPPRVKRTNSAQATVTINPLQGTDDTNDKPSAPRVPSSTQVTSGPKTADNSSSSEMDSLTNGMKKIKINLTTKAQREAREQAKLAAVTSTAATVSELKKTVTKPTKNPVEKSTKQSSPVEIKQNSQEPQLPPHAPVEPVKKTRSRPPTPSTPLPALPSRVTHLQEAAAIPLPASSPAGPVTQHHTPAATNPPPPVVATASNDSNVFIAYQPEGPAPAALQDQAPLKWLPPNTSTPSPMKRGDLPIFSATGAIPFAGAPNKVAAPPQPAQGSVVKQEILKQENPKPDASIWEVPETPGR